MFYLSNAFRGARSRGRVPVPKELTAGGSEALWTERRPTGRASHADSSVVAHAARSPYEVGGSRLV